jgi:hypothetical protein
MIIPGYIDSEFRVSARAFRAGVGAKLDIYIYMNICARIYPVEYPVELQRNP